MAPYVHTWTADDPRLIVVIAHGFGEHAGRYEHVARQLVDELGAAVYAPDHRGHGRTDGATGRVDDAEAMVDDLHEVAERARAEHAGLPLALVGHSMGGLLATRYAQRYEGELDALVLSGPLIGANPIVAELLKLDPLPEIPIDPDVLSRDAAVGAAYAADPLVYHGPYTRELLEELGATIERVAEGGSVGEQPTLWIHGEEDALVPLAYTRPAIARVRGSAFAEAIYPDARHEVFNETNQDEVIGEVVAFLRAAARG
jgi:alpha-beta hydrolase superfamily lysophospholipase